ncbi:MAG: cytochrome C [Terriglobia bacterium]|nr:MAG: cytochrome C [Terriglobia bacterium]
MRERGTVTAAVLIALTWLPGTPLAQEQNAEKLIRASDCSSCHAVDRQVVGPAYTAIAMRYRGQDNALETLAAKIRDGGSGMTAHADLTEPQRREIAAWILSQRDAAPAAGGGGARQYTYSRKDGTSVQVEFPVFVEGKNQKVTKEVFHGYQLYNSYCYRCHGTDATGGQLGPDLRRSLVAAMQQKEFLTVAMEGRKEKGMPGWAGFLSEDDVVHVYRYVKARSLDLISSGRPPSEQD